MNKKFLSSVYNVDMNHDFVSKMSANDWGGNFQSEYVEFVRSVKIGKKWYCAYKYYLTR